MSDPADRDGRRRRVLVAEDEPEVRQVYVEYLESCGFEVLEAANGLEALLHVKRGRPDFVVLDVSMPRLGGIEALKHIHAFDPTIEVVVVTAVPDPEVRQQAIERGARAVLAKPVALDALLATLRGEPVAPSPAPTPPAVAPAITASLLVVDDERAVREMLMEFLTEEGYETRGAPDAASAMRALAERAPDVILLDIDLPDLRGTDALPAIHALVPSVQVIMVSGTADDRVAKRALALGAFDYVVKPVDLAYLSRSLETALSMRTLDPPRGGA